LCPLDALSAGEQSRERRITPPDARLDKRDGAGDRIPNRRLIHGAGALREVDDTVAFWDVSRVAIPLTAFQAMKQSA
jgi:hypothetical protein